MLGGKFGVTPQGVHASSRDCLQRQPPLVGWQAIQGTFVEHNPNKKAVPDSVSVSGTRRREVPKREVLPDPKYGNQDLSKFVNVLMTAGKKSVAERILYGALEQVVKKSGKDPIEVFNLALGNVKPQVEVKSRRVGGANYQVPVEVRPSRRMALAMRWLKDFARKRGEKSMGMRLAGELIDASEGRGGAVKKREEVHRMAEDNKAFSHFRF